MTTPDPDQAILEELIALASRPERQLLQFRSLVGAHQYLGLYRMVRHYVPAGGTVLDWGTGNGHFSYFLTRAGYRATGFSIHRMAFTSWLHAPDFEAVQGSPGDPVRLPFADARFDAVSSVGVLEHVRETGGEEAASLREIARVLKPGGAFVCYHFPNRGSAIDFVARRVPGKHHHVFRYTAADIRKLVEAAGLTLRESERYAVLPRNASHHLPPALRSSRALARAWDALDGALAVPLGAIAQNHRFVAIRPA